ncbi:hypothetical protein OAC56_03170 [Flavobacteriaceae bacterium]|nr:hypothetical protein [Flavobacteriaceae bacterium]
MEKITLLHNMDDGYGAVYCVGKETFLLNEIHDYFRYQDGIPQDPVPESLRTPFKTVEALVTFLEKQLALAEKENDYTFFIGIGPELDRTDIFDNFLSAANPKGCGNNVDCLIVTHEGTTIFEF